MNKTKLLLLFSIVILIVSCQKEVNFEDRQQQASIIGNYDFVSMTATTKSIVTSGTGPLQEKIVTSSSFTSTNNTGTVAITTTKFNTTGIGYSINGIATGEFYIGGVLLNSLDFPFNFDLPPTDGSSDYRVITSDSIYFDNGFISYDPTGTGNPSATLPIGARTSWSGDTLLLKMVFSITTTQDIGGIMADVTNQGNQLVRLKKL